MSKFTPKFIGMTAIKTAIASATNRETRLKRHMQHVVLSAMYHTVQHGDWTGVTKLIEGTKLLNARLIGYCETHMNATYDKKAGTITFNEGKNAKDIDLETAVKVNWFEHKNAPQDNSKELQEIRDAIAKTLKTSVKADKVAETEQNEILAQIDILIEARNKVAVAA